MLVFSLAVAPLSVSHDATRAVDLLYCRSSSSFYPDQFFSIATSPDFVETQRARAFIHFYNLPV